GHRRGEDRKAERGRGQEARRPGSGWALDEAHGGHGGYQSRPDGQGKPVEGGPSLTRDAVDRRESHGSVASPGAASGSDLPQRILAEELPCTQRRAGRPSGPISKVQASPNESSGRTRRKLCSPACRSLVSARIGLSLGRSSTASWPSQINTCRSPPHSAS